MEDDNNELESLKNYIKELERRNNELENKLIEYDGKLLKIRLRLNSQIPFSSEDDVINSTIKELIGIDGGILKTIENMKLLNVKLKEEKEKAEKLCDSLSSKIKNELEEKCIILKVIIDFNSKSFFRRLFTTHLSPKERK